MLAEWPLRPKPRNSMPIPMNQLGALHSVQREALAGAMLEVLDSGWFVLGPQVERFEQAFADYCGVANCVGVGNGSDALELAMRALGIGVGDRVASVANAGFYASAAIIACGAQPLFVEVDEQQLQLDPTALEQVLAQQPKAVVVCHLFGRLAPVEDIVDRCRRAGVAVIEDCAQAHGARRNGRAAGSFGDIGCFSFYPTKNLGALGDGGAVVTDSAALADHLRCLRQHGWRDKYSVEIGGGRNSRLDALQAALLGVQLPLLDERNARRREIAAVYSNGIDHPCISPLPRGAEDDVVHLYVVRSPQRDRLQQHLADRGVHSDVHFPLPDHHQPVMLALGARDAISGAQQQVAPSLPITERACREVLSLPCHPALGDAPIRHIIDACNDFPR